MSACLDGDGFKGGGIVVLTACGGSMQTSDVGMFGRRWCSHVRPVVMARACMRPALPGEKEVLSLSFSDVNWGERQYDSILPTFVIAVSAFGLEETLKCASEIIPTVKQVGRCAVNCQNLIRHIRGYVFQI